VHIAAQPMNRDTGLGLLLPLAHIYHIRPDSTVVVFPSDHFIEEEDLFLNHVDAAFGLVERDSEKIVLLGIAPTQAETDYGYILPSDRWHNAFPFGAREVKHFIEKPGPILARKLVLRGGFWNTMVMVFHLRTLIEHMRAINPFVYHGFEQICASMDSAGFADIVKKVFARSEPLNVSKGLLEHLAAQQPRSLLVLPVRGVHWCDWGSEERIMSTARHALNGRLSRESSSNPFNALPRRRAAGTA
jgi:mannose-1-phosphate guanylyltransferase